MNNVQIYPAKIRIVPNFKLAKVVCNLTGEKFSDAIEGNQRGAIEKRNHKKHGDIITSYTITNADGYNDESPLAEFDRAILSVCISEWMSGNRYTTPGIIYRALTGKIERGTDAKPNKNQRAAILRSIAKLMGTILTIDLSETDEMLGYKTVGNAKKCSSILPAYYVERTVNGQDATAIFFDRPSPMMEIAESRDQFLRFDNIILDVPNQNNTPLIITLKNYVICRVTEIKQHRMTPTLTFADLFRKCRISDNASRDTKKEVRKTIINFFEHLAEKNAVKSFELVKNGVSTYGINFKY